MTDPAVAPPSRIEVRSTRLAGRYIVSARQNHFITDRRPTSGGPGEAPAPAELLLASLVSCLLAIVQTELQKQSDGDPAIRASALAERDPYEVRRFSKIKVEIAVQGLAEPATESLVDIFRDTCPIFNTLSQGCSVEILPKAYSDVP